jgi:hypothetical protein
MSVDDMNLKENSLKCQGHGEIERHSAFASLAVPLTVCVSAMNAFR